MRKYKVKIQDAQSNDLISFDIQANNKSEAGKKAKIFLANTKINDAIKYEIIKF